MKLYFIPLVFSLLTIIWEIKYIPAYLPEISPFVLSLSAFLMIAWIIGSYKSNRGTIASLSLSPFLFFLEYELTFNTLSPSFTFGTSLFIMILYFFTLLTWIFAIIEGINGPDPSLSRGEIRERISKILEDLEYIPPP